MRFQSHPNRWPLGLALTIGLLSGTLYWAMFSVHHGSDFLVFHFASKVWLSGKNAYAIGLPIMRGSPHPVAEPFYYPFPALVAIAPLTWMSVRVAGATFVGVSSGLLAFGVARESTERLPIFLGAGFLVAAAMGQWSPFITATLVLPVLSPLAVIKPNLGLATALAKPTATRIIGGVLVLLVTLVFQPSWPAEWMRNLRALPAHPAPVLVPGGSLVLLGLSRWRRPEARLLVAMACVPQLMYFADQLPLWLVARSRREGLFLSATSLVAWAIALEATTRAGVQPVLNSSPYVLAGVYFPALVLVLRRPNSGELPVRFERAIASWPTWLRGEVKPEPSVEREVA